MLLTTSLSLPQIETGRCIHLAWPIRVSKAFEQAALFAIGALVMSFLYRGGSVGAAADVGVPGHDSFYHIKMAEMLPEHGVLHQFPWLRFSYFAPEGNDFISHHYGFHVLLAPFIHASKALTGDPIAGGRWAMCTFAGLNVLLFYALLSAGGVRFRWAFLALLLILPEQFFLRHAYVRAMGPSLVCMQLLLLALIRHRPAWAGLIAGLYVQLYLGAVMYVPVIVGIYAMAHVLGPAHDRHWPWQVVVAAFAGWLIGVVLHPYAGGVYEFLKLQVFGTGLSPDIAVGNEWKPYNDVWWFATQLAGQLLLLWVGAIAMRLRFGPRIEARELMLLLLSVAYLVLTLKARRFIEYWPPICLLSASYLLAPLTAAWSQRLRSTGFEAITRSTVLRVSLAVPFVGLLAGALYYLVTERCFEMLFHSPALIAAAALFLFAPTLRVGLKRAAGYVPRWQARAYTLAGAAIVLLFSGVAGGAHLVSAQRSVRCGYDLPAVREVMDFVKQRSQPGDLIFTDDWDTFPVFFSFNAHNHYAVGLDPKFTHERRPDLWERYVRITRGDVPADAELERHAGRGSAIRESIHVELADIRDVFGARFVIVDRDHRRLAARLQRATDLARQVYPDPASNLNQTSPYVVFEILAADAT